MLDVPGSGLCFWSNKLRVPRSKVESLSSEVGVSGVEVGVSSSDPEVSSSGVGVPRSKLNFPSLETMAYFSVGVV